MKSTPDFSNQLLRLKSAVDNADAIVIGAGAGLSSSAGLDYGGKRFLDNFSDFHEKYGITDMYSGGFFRFESREEYWAWWSRHVYVNRFSEQSLPLYNNLYGVIKNKNYFVITTNVDHCFQKAGFDKNRLFYTQGDYGLYQCSVPCHDKTYDNEQIIRRMVKEQKDMKIPTSLIPYCPVCGKPMTLNLRCDDTFVEDDGWHAALQNYEKFIRDNENKKILFWELGVGMNTPSIIKFPFWKMTYLNINAVYACVNIDAFCPEEIRSRSICISDDIKKVINSLAQYVL